MSFFRGRTGNKFGNKKGSCGKHSHRSQLEIAVCMMLQEKEERGILKIIQCEDHVYLSKARVLYIPDWKCLDMATQTHFWVEAKGQGCKQGRWPTVKRLWKHYGPGKLEIWGGTYLSPKLEKIIVPEGEEA